MGEFSGGNFQPFSKAFSPWIRRLSFFGSLSRCLGFDWGKMARIIPVGYLGKIEIFSALSLGIRSLSRLKPGGSCTPGKFEQGCGAPRRAISQGDPVWIRRANRREIPRGIAVERKWSSSGSRNQRAHPSLKTRILPSLGFADSHEGFLGEGRIS